MMELNYSKYLKVCRDAVEYPVVFSTFKKRPNYTYVLEHVSETLGEEYLNEIKDKSPYLLKYLTKFITNDSIGKPNTYFYKEIGCSISPTTLRYIKVLGDLINLFGQLNDMDIIEIGGGYGGQCKIIYDVSKPRSYTLVDLPDVLALSKKYLSKFDINNVSFKAFSGDFKSSYDLCVSNYAFTEIGREYQFIYAKNIIKPSHKGYITCNFMGKMSIRESYCKDEILALKDNYKILPEIPLTSVNNLIYTWNRANL
jgi:putative sugar O-methyltransferase